MLQGLLFVLQHPLNNGRFKETVLRLFWWKCNQIFTRFPIIVYLTKKIKCICYPDSSYGSLVVYTTWPEYYEMEFIRKNLSKKSTFVDVGAGFGDYSLLAASQIQIGKIVTFEPNQQIFTRLLENRSINYLENIMSCYPYAVSNKNGLVFFEQADVSELSHLSSSNKSSGKHKVKTVKLDSFLTGLRINTVDILKIDVEGAELLVLQGAEKLLKTRSIKKILFELNPKSRLYEISPLETLTYLSKFGYNFYLPQESGLVPVSISAIVSNDITQNIIALAA